MTEQLHFHFQYVLYISVYMYLQMCAYKYTCTYIYIYIYRYIFMFVCIVVLLLTCIWFFVIPWTEAHQAPLSSTICQNLLKFMSLSQWCYLNGLIHSFPLILCLQSFPESESFPMSQLFASGGETIGASASVLPMNIQG